MLYNVVTHQLKLTYTVQITTGEKKQEKYKETSSARHTRHGEKPAAAEQKLSSPSPFNFCWVASTKHKLIQSLDIFLAAGSVF